MLTILFFGRLSEAAGGGERRVALPPGVADTDGLRQWLARDDPALGAALAQPVVATAVDGTVSQGNVPLAGDEEVAFMPPVSGG